MSLLLLFNGGLAEVVSGGPAFKAGAYSRPGQTIVPAASELAAIHGLGGDATTGPLTGEGTQIQALTIGTSMQAITFVFGTSTIH